MRLLLEIREALRFRARRSKGELSVFVLIYFKFDLVLFSKPLIIKVTNKQNLPSQPF